MEKRPITDHILNILLILVVGIISAFASSFPSFWNVYIGNTENTFTDMVAQYVSFSPLLESIAQDLSLFLPGLVFGCVFLVLVRMYGYTRVTFGNIFLTIAGSSFAYFLAYLVAAYSQFEFMIPVSFFFAGMVGALLFLCAAWRLTSFRWSVVAQLVLWGGVLGAISEPLFYNALKLSDTGGFGETPDLTMSFISLFSLFLVWQTGMLLLMYFASKDVVSKKYTPTQSAEV